MSNYTFFNSENLVMFRPLSLFLGLRYTKAERSNRFISFISLISIIGLTLGVAVLITVLSVMNGFDKEIKARILGMVSHASVTSDQVILDWKPLTEEIKKNPQVQEVAPFIHLQGMLTVNGQVAGIMVSGIEPEFEKNVSIVDDYMLEGSLDNLDKEAFGIVLGTDMALSLGLTVGDKVTLVLPEASPSVAGIIPRFKRFTLVGTFDVSKEMNTAFAYIAMSDAAKLLRIPDGAQGIRMNVKDLFLAPKTARDVAQISPERLFPDDWTTRHSNLFNAIQMEKAMIGLLLFLIVIVAAFNIVSSLVMMVTDKKADIAILKTFGATPKLIRNVFIIQGMLIGVVGTLLGTALGVTLALSVGDVLSYINTVFNLHLFDVYPVNSLPSDLKLSDVLIINAVSFVLCFVMTIYPAKRAANTQPAQTLRYE